MIKRFFFLFVLAIYSCQPNEKAIPIPTNLSPAEQLLSQSIAYHDPQGNWSKLKSSVDVNTELRMDSIPELSQRHIHFNNLKGEFALNWDSKKIGLSGVINSDTCYVNPNKEISKEERNEIAANLGCERISMYKDYYHYLLGIPMKLMEDKAIITDSILQRTHDDIKYDVVKINYEPLDQMPSWYFYFDQKDHSLQLCKFTSAEDENEGGEYILYNGETLSNGIKFKKRHIWLYNTPERDTLAIEDYTFSKLFIK